MKIQLLAALAVLSLLLPVQSGVAAEKSDASTELKALITKIQTKMRAGKETEADLAPELKEFDALLAKHKGEKTDDVAQILLMKAMLYQQVLKDTAKGEALMAQLKQDFPDSEQVKMMKQQEESTKVRAGLVIVPTTSTEKTPKTSTNACKYRVLCMFDAPLVNHKKLARMG